MSESYDDLLHRLTSAEKAELNLRICQMLDRYDLLDDGTRCLAAALAIESGVPLPSEFITPDELAAVRLAIAMGYCATDDPELRAETLNLSRKLVGLREASPERQVSVYDQLQAALDDLQGQE